MEEPVARSFTFLVIAARGQRFTGTATVRNTEHPRRQDVLIDARGDRLEPGGRYVISVKLEAMFVVAAGNADAEGRVHIVRRQDAAASEAAVPAQVSVTGPGF